MTKIFDVQGNLLGDTGGPAQPVPFPEVVDVPATLVNGLLASSATVGDILTVTTGNWQNMGDEGPKITPISGGNSTGANCIPSWQGASCPNTKSSLATAAGKFARC
jgi:hypothetical protein